MGSKRIGLRSLHALKQCSTANLLGVVTPDDRSDARSCTADFAAFCKLHSIPLYIVKSQRDADAVLTELQPTRCLVVGWYWLVSPLMLQKVPGGIIGIHNSLLPRYRGCAPLVWAMINGDESVGISLFSFSEGMDDGPVWGQRKVPVRNSDTIGTVLSQLETHAAELISTVWPRIEDGTTSPMVQVESEATYCGLRTPEDGRIDWQKSAAQLHDFVRAQSEPYPGAWTTLANGQKMTVWSSDLRSSQVFFGTPGQVLQLLNDGIVVSCGQNTSLLLTKISIEGCEPVNPRSVTNSLRIRFGTAGAKINEG
jgi:methionyl-tRNA formyltransferase